MQEAMQHFDPDEMKAQIQMVVDNVADMHMRMIRIEAKLDNVIKILNLQSHVKENGNKGQYVLLDHAGRTNG